MCLTGQRVFLTVANSALQAEFDKKLSIKWDVVDKTGKGGMLTTAQVAQTLLHSKACRDVIITEILYIGQSYSVLCLLKQRFQLKI